MTQLVDLLQEDDLVPPPQAEEEISLFQEMQTLIVR